MVKTCASSKSENNNNLRNSNYLPPREMPPITRPKNKRITPECSPKHREANTVKKTKFFDAWDEKSPSESKRAFFTHFQVAPHTGRRWLHERNLFGISAYRSARKNSENLGRPRIIDSDTLNLLASPSKNPIRQFPYEAQLNHHNISASTSTVKRRIRETEEVGFHAQQFTKPISKPNKIKRVQYAKNHVHDTVDNYWCFVLWTDEAHFDPASQRRPRILRKRGTRYDADNIFERPPLKGNQVHFASWITWWAKGPLIFYHDEEEHEQQPKAPPKPRRSKYKPEEQYQKEVIEWEASKPKKEEVKPKGNSMTMKYYCDNILPEYLQAIRGRYESEAFCPRYLILHEDGDSSHGKRGDGGLAGQMKKGNNVIELDHPPQSPDMNPIEAIWCILKQRVCNRIWENIEGLKQVLREERDRITIKEIRERIEEMPKRCRELDVVTGSRNARASATRIRIPHT